MKINWYGIWFDICLGTQCTELSHTHIQNIKGGNWQKKHDWEILRLSGHAPSTTKRGAKIWLTQEVQEADAKSWSSLKHLQPKEGRKELAPREIKFRYRRLDTTIRERAGSSQEGRKRAKDTPGYFLCFFFLFIPKSRCNR